MPAFMCKLWTRVISCFESVLNGVFRMARDYSVSCVVGKLGLITFGEKLFPGESEAEGLGGWSTCFPFVCLRTWQVLKDSYRANWKMSKIRGWRQRFSQWTKDPVTGVSTEGFVGGCHMSGTSMRILPRKWSLVGKSTALGKNSSLATISFKIMLPLRGQNKCQVLIMSISHLTSLAVYGDTFLLSKLPFWVYFFI